MKRRSKDLAKLDKGTTVCYCNGLDSCKVLMGSTKFNCLTGTEEHCRWVVELVGPFDTQINGIMPCVSHPSVEPGMDLFAFSNGHLVGTFLHDLGDDRTDP